MREPAQRECSAAVIFAYHRPPPRPATRGRLRLRALNLDHLVVFLEALVAVRCQVGVRVVRIMFQQYQVRPVAPGIREPPRDRSIAAGYHERCAGEHHTRKIQGFPLTLGRIHEKSCAVPDVRDVEVQMHVVRHDRAAGRGPVARNGPGVTAIDGFIRLDIDHRGGNPAGPGRLRLQIAYAG